MNSGDDPTATDEQIYAAYQRLNRRDVKPITDVVSVASVKVIPVTLSAQITLYPGPDASTVLTTINAAINSLKTRIARSVET
jgi:phage-related baseplate assembly protein